MANQNAKIDENRRKTLMGVTDDVASEVRRILVDPATGRLKVSAVISGIDVTTADIADSTDKRYVTDAGLVVLGNTSGTNSGDETATTVGALINGATEKTTIADTDFFGLMDSAAANILKKFSWANLKIAIKAFFVGRLTVTVGFDASCDYVCDGTEDNVQIQAAIDYVDGLGGGNIKIKAGLYDIYTGIVGYTANHYSNINIFGDGKEVTILKASRGVAIITFGNGNASLTTQHPENIKISSMTIDMNSQTGACYGLALAAKDVTLRDLHIKNQANGAKAMLFFGVSSNASSAMVVRNLVVDNCTFSDSDAAWEAITLAQAFNCKFTNCTFRDKTSLYMFLNYGTYDVSVVGCQFLNCGNGVNGKGATVFSACNFFNSHITVQASNTLFIGCTFGGDSLTASIGIKYLGYVVTSSEMFWDEEPENTNVRLKNNKVIGCIFKNCNTNSISSLVYTGYGSVTVISSKDITVKDCSFENTEWQGVYIVADSVNLSGNTLYNSGQLLSASVRYNFVIAAKTGLIKDNHSFDDQGSPTALKDFFIDNQYVAILPDQNLTFENNDFEIGSIPYFYSGGAFTATKPANITIHGRSNKGYVTENSGTSIVASGQTTIVVDHGLSVTPTADDISVTPTNGMGNASKFWITTLTATQFTINVDVDPGADTATFAWKAIVL
jgi:hypothetical protein